MSIRSFTPAAPAAGGTQAEAPVPAEVRMSSGPVLLLALRGDSPLAGGQSFDLSGVQELVIGRGGALALMPGASPGCARLELPDPTVSGRHAQLRISRTEVVIEDLGSRNGTRVAGAKASSAKLEAGGWFVVGRSVFVWAARETLPAGGQGLAGRSSRLATFVPALANTFETARSLAPSRVPLLLVAETGTGKEVLAREIHALSGRQGSFVAVNCAALPEALVESELFGYRRGAFSEAKEDRPGLIRSAESGTLFLDEVAELPLASQAKLLRVLQEHEVLPLGGTRPVPVDIRIIAATQPRLDLAVQAGAFRADLLGRLAGYTLRLPPLRERLADLGLLVALLLEKHAGPQAAGYKLTADACAALFRRRWPLNVRELDQALQAAVVLAASRGEIDVSDFGEEPAVLASEAPQDPEALRQRLEDSLLRHRGNISAVARELGKARMQIHRWMDRFGLSPEGFRDTPPE